MAEVRSPLDEKLELLARSPGKFSDIMLDMARAFLRNDLEEVDRLAESELAPLVGQTMTLADLVGRRRLFLEVDALAKDQIVSFRSTVFPVINFDTTPVFPKIDFPKAIDDLVTREPRIADPKTGEPRWVAVARTYVEDHAFSIARSTKLNVITNVQRIVTDVLAEGKSREQAIQEIMKAGGRAQGWTQAYAETVLQTNLSSAYEAGRFDQMKDPDVIEVAPAAEFLEIGDGDSRENHEAAGGTIAPIDNPIWDRISPPLGFR
jgi:hypothetical protein